MASKPREEMDVGFENADKTEAWRYREFKRMGFDPIVAELLTLDRNVDLHGAERLLKSGCSLETAKGILL